jgi:ubiquinone/menaquinone biosynthesis C-methylase UbiE
MKRVDYDQVSAVYDERYQAGGPAGIAEALQALVDQVQARRVLEVGCGTGYWLASLRNCEMRCGLDYSTGMLSKARLRDRALPLVRGTAGRLPFRQGTFDFLFCVHALHHFDDPPAFFHEACRALGPGAAIAVIGTDPQTEQDRWYVYDCFPGTREMDLVRYPSGEAMLRWMQEAGFVRCGRHIVARIVGQAVGHQVLEDPILQKNGTSQLSLLTDEAFAQGMARIRDAVQAAETQDRELVFYTDIAVPMVVGFLPGGPGSRKQEAESRRQESRIGV